ncbi:hypothetical protein [uncultured Sphingomonas sp.]|nr:hypothetical protein [uncultured Sphingomonas sp.]
MTIRQYGADCMQRNADLYVADGTIGAEVQRRVGDRGDFPPTQT